MTPVMDKPEAGRVVTLGGDIAPLAPAGARVPRPASPEATTPVARARRKTATRRSVSALMDELSPPRRLTRNEQRPGPVEDYRTASGCVLQGPESALSVSWFSDDSATDSEGELYIRAWRGKLFRRGGADRPAGAHIVTEVVLHPVHVTNDECEWRAPGGEQFDFAGLVQHCHSLLAAPAAPPD